MSQIINLNKSVLVNAGSCMKDIASPLKKHFNITYFGYVKSYLDGTQLALSVSPEWLSCLYQNFHSIAVVSKKIESYKNGYDLWSQYSSQITVSAIRNEFHFAHGLHIIKKSEKYCEFFGFATTPDNYSIQNWYLNNIDILENFILYFKSHAKKLITSAEADRLILPKNLSAPLSEIYNDTSLINARELFLNEICLKENPDLTTKEFQCVKYIAQGYSMKETARLLHISPRTVETHLEKIKQKINAKTLAEITAKLILKYPWALNIE